MIKKLFFKLKILFIFKSENIIKKIDVKHNNLPIIKISKNGKRYDIRYIVYEKTTVFALIILKSSKIFLS
tara:strand:+ start:277 stop:486 length:210 start_codon:yes stop_codon:yes gene_type:complete